MQLILTPEEIAQVINKHFGTKTAGWNYEGNIEIDMVLEKLDDSTLENTKLNEIILKRNTPTFEDILKSNGMSGYRNLPPYAFPTIAPPKFYTPLTNLFSKVKI